MNTPSLSGPFTATPAQEYYWEICEGNATINGSNTSQTVSINATNSYKLKLVRFINGNCIEACENVNAGIPTKSVLIQNEGGPGADCTGALVTLTGVTASSIDYVNWTWAIGGSSGTLNNQPIQTSVFYPPGFWDNYYLVVCATAINTNGTVCPEVCNSLLLECSNIGNPDNGGGDPPRIDNNGDNITEGEK